ncbi:MAG TPA: hypothetical protein VG943_14910 [Caulobacterales bacterium]|nr:hypothetical protein [Caulobacterales bacterium]
MAEGSMDSAANEILRTARRGANRVRVDLARAYADLAKAYEDAGRAGAETGEVVSEAAELAWVEARKRALEASKPVRAAVSDHPMVAVSAAVAVGAALGVLLTRRR